jgi:multicomponent Na+:H+ antiporter subunit B
VTRRARLVLFLAGALGVGWLLVAAFLGLPGFGASSHPYGDRAVAASLAHKTANTVASVTFDQRGTDTLGEEFILFAAALGATVLLRRLRDEDEDETTAATYGPEDVVDAVRLMGYLLLPVTLLVAAYVVAHGHVSPGGGFQGGVVLATGIHLLYLAGDYSALERLRPLPVFDIGEAIGAGAFVVVGIAAALTGAAFLANVLPLGTVVGLGSAGTVPLLNVATGLEVGSGVVLVFAHFLEQALVIHEDAAGAG